MDRERVLREMVESGLSATELGPDGYLPTDPVELKEFLDRFDMSIVGGFVPALLYREDRVDDQLAYVTRAARQLASTGSKVLVLGPSSANPGYDTPVDMSDDEWTTFLANLRRLESIVGDAGLEARARARGRRGRARQDGRDRAGERGRGRDDAAAAQAEGYFFAAA